jgi:succinate dehydrogenase/fumarate reductase flavoprotein subunit
MKSFSKIILPTLTNKLLTIKPLKPLAFKEINNRGEGSMRLYLEKEKEIPILSKKDVIVIGGGPAGVGAAVRASREGMDTLLIEHYGFLGGGHTAGMIGTFCGLYNVDKGRPVYTAKGLVHEINVLMREKDALSGPIAWFNTFIETYDHFILKHTLDKVALNEAKLSFLFHTTLVDVIMNENQIKGVIVENKSGRHAIFGKVIIDCSGDGDVAARAGAPYEIGATLQFPTMMFKMMNVDQDRAVALTVNEVAQLLEKGQKEFELPRTQGWIIKTPRKGEILLNLTKAHRNGLAIDGTKVEDLTYAELICRDQVIRYAEFLKKYIPGFEDSCIEDSGAAVAVRETRKIKGGYTLKPEDVLQSAKHYDGIAASNWPVEVYEGKSVVLKWVPEGDVYEVPFRCLIPHNIEGLIVAGRCLSATHEAHASARTWAISMDMGEAAGMAAADSIKLDILPRKVDGSTLRERLDMNLGRTELIDTITQVIDYDKAR